MKDNNIEKDLQKIPFDYLQWLKKAIDCEWNR